ncbi:MAG: preprotein translocase subunit SecG [Anaerolineae bacterium]|nr:preprotein translocase subunit SecG [Anaerolineae bacterium]
MLTFLYVAQILIALGVIALVMLQARSEGAGGMFGQGDGIARTRRGVERTIFNLTIGFAALFLLIAIITVIVQR